MHRFRPEFYGVSVHSCGGRAAHRWWCEGREGTDVGLLLPPSSGSTQVGTTPGLPFRDMLFGEHIDLAACALDTHKRLTRKYSMGPGQKPLSLVTVCNSPSATAKEILRNSRPTNHARCEKPGIIKRWSVRSLPHRNLLHRNPRRPNPRRPSLRHRRMKGHPRTCSRCPGPRRATAR
jgi:hypothetical protein